MRKYTVIMTPVAVSAAKTLIEITAPGNGLVEVVRAWCTQSSSTTSAMQQIQILRKASTVTGSAGSIVRLEGVGGFASASTAKVNATSEGSDGDVLYFDTFNVLNGFLYVPVPEERIVAQSGGIVALKLPTAPVNSPVTFIAGMTFLERGG